MSPTEPIRRIVESEDSRPAMYYVKLETIYDEEVYVPVDDPGLKALAEVPEEDLPKHQVKYEKGPGVGNGSVNIGEIVIPESEQSL
jgi:hypothetical protein